MGSASVDTLDLKLQLRQHEENADASAKLASEMEAKYLLQKQATEDVALQLSNALLQAERRAERRQRADDGAGPVRDLNAKNMCWECESRNWSELESKLLAQEKMNEAAAAAQLHASAMAQEALVVYAAEISELRSELKQQQAGGLELATALALPSRPSSAQAMQGSAHELTTGLAVPTRPSSAPHFLPQQYPAWYPAGRPSSAAAALRKRELQQRSAAAHGMGLLKRHPSRP